MAWRRSTVLIAVLLLPTLARAERLPLKIYSTAEGLPHYVVNRIVRDSHGFLWFCTREGLSRFDGYDFTTYGVEHGLPAGNVTAFIETREGTHWLGTSAGLVRFDPAGRSTMEGQAGEVSGRMFTSYGAAENNQGLHITSMVQDRSGTLWVGTTTGLYRLTIGGDRVRLEPVDLGLPDRLLWRHIESLLADRTGALWIGAGRGIYLRTPDGVLTSISAGAGLPETSVNTMLEDRAGHVWAGTRTAGLWRFTRDSSGRPTVVRRYSERDGLLGPWVTQMFQGADGTLWAGSTSGLMQFTATPQGDLVALRAHSTSAGLPGPEVTALTEDRNGNLWIGIAAYGAVKLSRAGFTTFGTPDGLTWSSGMIQTKKRGLVLLGTHDQDWSLYCVVGEKLLPVKPLGASRKFSWGWNQVLLEDREGDWWIALGEGLFRYPEVETCADLERTRPKAVYDRRRGLPTDVVLRIFEDFRGDIWISTVGHAVRPNGLSRWSRTSGTIHHFGSEDGLPSFERDYVSAFSQDAAGNVWIGFSVGGLARYRNNRFTLFTSADGLPGGQVRNLTLDDRGRLWAASYRGGLCRIENPTADRPTFRTYTTADGLSGNETHAVVTDRMGDVYVGTARGIDRLDPDTGRLRHFTASDGLPPQETNGALRDAAGALWFTYTSGLVRFVPHEDVPHGPPVVLITGLRVAGQPHLISALGQVEVPPLELPAHRNSVQIDFSALGFGPGEGLQYQYRLDGGDGNWSRASDRRTVNYASLSPGSYRFEVRAQSADGAVSELPARFAFTIVPPVWQRPWFIAFAVLSAALAGYGLYRYRVVRLIEIAEMRERIATDLHDDIGTNLTRIAVLGEVARQQGARGDGTLATIAGIARESVATMSDIVWAIDPGHDKLVDLIRKMRNHAEEVFGLGDVRLTFSAPKEAEQLLQQDFRHDVFLISKEVINNVACHARATHVGIEIRVEGSRLFIQIIDDGSGFRQGDQSEGHGLLSIRRRAERLGAALDIDSQPGHGTSVTLIIPFIRSRRPTPSSR